jgi:hypothetical protein
MKKIKSLFLCGLLHCCIGGLAQVQQIWGDPHVRQQYTDLAFQDPAYKKFRSELDKLMKTARGSNTNYTAVKALISQNKTVLNELYKRSNIQPPATGHVIKKTIPKAVSITTGRLRLSGSTLQQTKTPPYQATWRWTNQGGGMTLPDTSFSQYTSGKSAFVFGPTNGWTMPYRLGAYSQGMYHDFTVPSNPEIIEAEVRIEYSYLFAGWDTYGGCNGVELVVRANKEFVSPELKSLPLANQSHGYPATYSGGNQPGYNGNGNGGAADSFRVVSIIIPRDTVTTDIQDWSAEENNGVFTVRGHVYPGNHVKFNFGIGYMVNTARGPNGSYHYLECRVKKVIVTFLKAGD